MSVFGLAVTLSLLSLALLWLGWRYWHLIRALNDLLERLLRTTNLETTLRTWRSPIPDAEALQAALTLIARHFEQTLKEQDAERARLSTALEQIGDAVLLVDPRGQVVYANAATWRIFPPESGRSLTEVLRQHQLVSTWREAVAQNREMSITLTLPRSQKVLHFTALPDRYVSGGAVILVQDITRLHQLEEVRRHFISNLSHELRTPLASIKALSETLQDGALEDPPAARRFLARMVVEVDAINQMTQELLDLSRIESGAMQLAREPVSPESLLQTVAERMALQAEQAGLILKIEPTASLPLLHLDRARMEQVLLNLVHNAIKFTPRGGRVTLSAEALEQDVVFYVHDTGVGIAKDDLPHIFERFYKVDRARRSSGTGLGLSIARHIVRLHDGRIWAESIEGQGSTFFIAIPYRQAS